MKQLVPSLGRREAIPMRKLRTVLGVATAIFLSVSTGLSADFEKGAAAYQRGDYTTALREWRPLAEAGDATAQYNLGGMYYKGHGVPQDYVEALRWYSLAEVQGVAAAQHDLGVMYYKGHGVPQDHAAAARWYRRAAEQGNASSQYNLGLMYDNGQGVVQNYTEAIRWYRKAAEQGSLSAQHNLGLLYASGEGVPQDYAEAVRWYRRAAEHGHADTQNNLGLMYAQGRGVLQDYVQAHKWFNLSAAGAPPGESRNTAVRNRDILARKMTPAQIAEAQRLAREFRAKPAAAQRSPIQGAAIDDPSLVAAIQTGLEILGYSIGRVDGEAGPRTRRAIRSFQVSRGLTPSGEVSLDLLDAIANQVDREQQQKQPRR